MFHLSFQNEAELDQNIILHPSLLTIDEVNKVLHIDKKTSSRKDLKKYLFDKIQDFSGYWEPCKQPK